MTLRKVRRLIIATFTWWCIAAVALACALPFLSTHFRHDGWEDEPAMRFVSIGASANFEPDSRNPSSSAEKQEETTLFVSPGIQFGSAELLGNGLAQFLAAILLAIPICLVALCCVLPSPGLVARTRRLLLGKPPPPLKLPWRSVPPVAAPPTSD